MRMDLQTRCTAFAGNRRVASGALAEVARTAKAVIDAGEAEPILIFDDATSEQLEVDLRGTVDDVRHRLTQAGRSQAAPAAETPRGPGRPKLGVVAREVTLLPRHWEWLNAQPGGASVALRKLVDAARRTNEGSDRLRQSREAAYRFMSVMAGNLPGFEEATRALFGGHRERFDQLIESWPADVRRHARTLTADAFPNASAMQEPGVALFKS
jgi:uncharacterized protein